MTRIVAIVEGQTEQAFIQNQLAVHLGQWGTDIRAVLSGKSRGQGGVRNWESARNDIVRTLKEGRYCTTMFDFYAMPANWPGRADSTGMRWNQRRDHVEAAMLRDVAACIGDRFDSRQFIPYVQVHEFEALVFSDVRKLAEVSAPLCHPPVDHLAGQLSRILEEAVDPEAIDDGYETCPSRRIKRLVRGYRKRVHGPIVTQRIGLDVLRSRCGHFASWLQRLERVAQLSRGSG